MELELSKDLVNEFVAATDDRTLKTLETTCYGTAKFQNGGEYVQLDGADSLTPAVFTVAAHQGDRVLVLIKGRKALVIGNITTPVITTGILKANVGIIVNGYLTTNADRTSYNDTTKSGLTFSAGGIGAYGGNGKWYATNDGAFYMESATVKGDITAQTGSIGGLTIGENKLYSGQHSAWNSNNEGVFISPEYIALGANGFSYLKKDGTFQLGGANGITYSNNKVTLGSGVELTWNSISDASGHIPTDVNQLNDASGQKWSTTVGENFIKTTSVTAQNLVVKAAKIDGTLTASQINTAGLIAEDISTTTLSGKTISGGEIKIGTPTNNVYPFQVTTAGTLTASGATISGAITATSLTLANGVKVPASTGVSGLATVATSGNYNDLSNKVDTSVFISVANDGTISIQKNNGTAKAGTVTKTYGTTAKGFSISTNGLLEASNAVIYGSIYASAGTIGGWSIDSGKLSKTTINITEGNETVTYEAYMQGYNGTPGGGNTAFGIHRTVGSNTTLPFAVYYDGTIHAEKGTIAGWSIDSNMIFKSITIDGTIYQPWLYAPANPSTGSYAFFVRKQASGASTWSYPFAVCYDGTLRATGAVIDGTLTAGAGSSIGPWTVDANAIYRTSSTYGNASGLYFGTSGISLTDKFKVSSAGVLTASSGTVGGFTLGANTFYSNEHSAWNTSREGIFLASSGDYPLSVGSGGAFKVGKNGVVYCTEAIYLSPTSGHTSGIVFKIGNDQYGAIYDNSNLYIQTYNGGSLYLVSNDTVGITSSGDISLNPGSGGDGAVSISSDCGVGGDLVVSGSVIFTKTADAALLKNTYNGSTYNLIRNHNNGNISISASGSGLYLGYENTTFVNLLNGKLTLNSQGQLVAANSIYAINTNGAAVVARLNADGTGNGIYMQCLSDGSVKITSRGANDTWYDILSRSNNSNAITTSGLWTFTDNVTISRAITGSVNAYVINSNHSVSLAAHQSAGIYSETHSKWLISINSSGTVSTTATSDIRLKNVCGIMPDIEALAILKEVDIINFTLKKDEKAVIQNGISAQQLRDVLIKNKLGYRYYLDIEDVESSNQSTYTDLDMPEEKVRYGIDYGRLTPILWKGWQIHDDRITALEKENAVLRNEIQKLKGAA